MPIAATATPRLVRVITGVLLVAALGCFALNLVGITFDQTAIDQLNQLAPNSAKPPQSCFDDGLFGYSGFSLIANQAPAVNSGCLPNLRDGGNGALGVQPLVVAAALLIAAGIGAALLGRRGHRVLIAALSLCAIALLVINDLRFFDTFQARFTSAAPGSGPSLLISQAGAGFWAVLGLLLICTAVCAGYELVRVSRRALARV